MHTVFGVTTCVYYEVSFYYYYYHLVLSLTCFSLYSDITPAQT